jgi:ankyrin repeat protein
MHAARAGNVEVGIVLLAEGAEPTAKDSDGKTARAIALSNGETEFVEWLDQL